MKNFLRLIAAYLLALTVLLYPFPAMAQTASTISAAFKDADLRGKDFLKDEELSKQDYKEANFVSVKLQNANLSNLDLRGAVFSTSNLTGANLHGIDFTNGFGYIAIFDNVDLTDAILVESIILRSTFNGADVTGADFTAAILDYDQVEQLCQSASGVNSQTGVDTRESLGCF